MTFRKEEIEKINVEVYKLVKITYSSVIEAFLTLIRMTKDEKVLAIFKGLLL